ncbi:MAG TPA: ATP-binding protein [Frankiaceae bacterium]|jgi:anti-sigma regulatory factor (Ser/Thr protein kinase)|nr:ATP-binding protein [Frankiaceae bacterium]
MELRAHTTLPAGVDTPAAARAFVRDAVGREDALPVEDLTLVVSELVTNAVVSGSEAIDLEISVAGAHVLVEVADDAPAAAPLTPLAAEDSHRGLMLVSRLASRWGVRKEGVRKVLWADLATA